MRGIGPARAVREGNPPTGPEYEGVARLGITHPVYPPGYTRPVYPPGYTRLDRTAETLDR